MAFSAEDQKKYLAAQKSLRAYCITLTLNASAADDLVQETMLKAWANSHQFKDGTNMNAWLFVIARNTFFSETRKSKRTRYVGDNNDLQTAVPSFDFACKGNQLASLELDDLLTEIARMPAEQQQALFMLALGESYEDAAQKSGVAIGTIKSRTHRARKHIEQHMNAEPAKKQVIPKPKPKPVTPVQMPAPATIPAPPVPEQPAPVVITQILPAPAARNDNAFTERETLERLSTHKRILIRAIRNVLAHEDTNAIYRSDLARLAKFIGYPLSTELRDCLNAQAAAKQLGVTPDISLRLYDRFERQFIGLNYVTVPPGKLVAFRMAFNTEADRVEGYVPQVQLSMIRRVLPACLRA